MKPQPLYRLFVAERGGKWHMIGKDVKLFDLERYALAFLTGRGPWRITRVGGLPTDGSAIVRKGS